MKCCVKTVKKCLNLADVVVVLVFDVLVDVVRNAKR